MTVCKLTKRQMRWSLILSCFNFTILYLPRKENVRADALSRREQDLLAGLTDDRLQLRMARLIKPEALKQLPIGSILVMPVQATQSTEQPSPVSTQPSPGFTDDDLDRLWTAALRTDRVYDQLVQTIRDGQRTFPSALRIRVSASECLLSSSGALLFRDRRWVPDSSELRTKLIQAVHDSVLSGHPGREATMAILMRQFFWPGMAQAVRQFVRNCDSCGRNKVWRDRRQGFLKPLLVLNRIWREISIDFITKLSLSNGCTDLLVITDRLSKGVILEACSDTSAEAIANLFLRVFYRRHRLLSAIMLDRDTQFVSALWARVCSLLRITRRLSTAWHLETDGATERMN
jgi:hypothetical protein